MNKEIIDIIERICNERNIQPDVLFEAVEQAVASATKKMMGLDLEEIVRVELNRSNGEFRVFAPKMVVEEVDNPDTEILLAEALKIHPKLEADDRVEVDVTPKDFGRIAAQSAKQVIIQRLREAEREMVYDKFRGREGELIAGTVSRFERGNVIVDLGITEAILPREEQPFGERYRVGDRLRALLKEVKKSSKDPQLVLTRKDDQFLIRLFEQEVPEIADKIVIIKRVAREAGRRAKVAVMSTDSDVDAVGACVGMKGSRVQMIVQELRGERIDIVEYSDDPRRMVSNALKPAEIESVQLAEDSKRAFLIVRNDQLSLAIGKGGLNARLASKLTGVEIDIIPESAVVAKDEATRQLLVKLEGITEALADKLMENMVFSYEDIVQVGPAGLAKIEGIDATLADQLYIEAVGKMQERAIADAQAAAGKREILLGEERPRRSRSDMMNESLRKILAQEGLLGAKEEKK